MWWTRKPRPALPCPEPATGAREALQRATDADKRADVNGNEMRTLTGKFRAERERNHFAPLILDAMNRPR